MADIDRWDDATGENLVEQIAAVLSALAYRCDGRCVEHCAHRMHPAMAF
jgi:hypothetical protein